MDTNRQQIEAGRKRAAAMTGTPEKVFRSAAQFEGARRAAALNGTKALRGFDEQHRREIDQLWCQRTNSDPATESQLDRLWQKARPGAVMAKPSAKIKMYSISDASFEVMPSGVVGFDRFKKTILRQGVWTHPQNGFTLDASASFLRDLAAKFKRLCGKVDSFVALGHSRDPLHGVGHIADLDVAGTEGALELVATVDITEPEVARKLKNKSIRGVSIGLDENFEVSLPDGRVERVGNWLEHLAISQVPVIGGMGDFEFIPIN